jgi:NAD-dependent deacetylase
LSNYNIRGTPPATIENRKPKVAQYSEVVVNETDAVLRAAKLLREAHYAIALTGAGSSTPSGIPDFRSPGTGLWEKANPMEVASIYAFRRHPRAFYEWMRPLADVLLNAEPNPGHRALAELEAEGLLKAIITQNIDGLHQQAGSREVLEIHGHLRKATCIDCYHILPVPELLDDFLTSEEMLRCPKCDGFLKPNVVLFGEQLPVKVFNAAMHHVRRADVMLIAGSSLEVMPVSQFPLQVRDRGGRLIVVNLSSTYVDDIADVVIHDDLAEVLPRIVQACID